ncbi:MAG: HAD family hydrolase [Patescibacteria group bacterium]|nr:HAD family hydrolase [Patescibacteria group bacterium]
MKIKLVGLDVNGTSFDDTAIFWEAINGIFPRFGLPRLSLAQLQKEFGQPWTSIYRKNGLTEQMADDHELYRVYNELYRQQPEPKPADGLREALESLTRQGVRLAILTTQQDVITRPLLKKYDLYDYFAYLVCGISDKAEELRILSGMSHIPTEKMAYVGDQEGDVRHANAAGCVSIGYTGGLHSFERLRSARPQFIIKSMRGLSRLPIF